MAEWTGSWVAQRLSDHDRVQNITLLSPQLLLIERVNDPAFVALTIAETRVEPEAFQVFVDNNQDIKFIINVPSEGYWTGDAIQLMLDRAVAFGGLGDLFRATREPEPRLYKSPEFVFVERGLRQHTRVSDYERIHDRKYLIMRTGLPNLNVVFLNDYELTADHVRTARDRYGEFSVIAKTNPNGRITTAAHQAAATMDAEIFGWGNFLGRLNKP